MLIYNAHTEIESYKSYKARKFNEYEEKLRKIINGIDDTSLKPEHKIRLKFNLSDKLLNHTTTP